MKYTIGILNTVQLDGKFYVTNQKYIDFCKLFGEVVGVDPNSKRLAKIDILIMPGGRDVYPLRYNQFPDEECGMPDLVYEYFDKYILPLYIKAKIPIFGICRGMQTLAVHFGADMIQHAELPMSTGGKYFDKGKRGKIVEHMIFDGGFEHLEGFPTGINSLHHQIVDLVDLPKIITPIAYSATQGNLEIFKIKGLPIIGVQMHPEELKNKKLFVHLVESLLPEKVEVLETEEGGKEQPNQ